jgi:thiaminase
MTDTTLTTHLLSLASTTLSLERATTHTFLTNAGAGTLPSSTLIKWLVQDIHYTRGYVRFIGGVMSQLRLSTSIQDDQGKGKTLHVRIFDLLLSALNNIQREMQFFEDTAKEYKLDLNLKAEMEPVTRMYVQCFDAVKSGSGAGGLLEGLTVLWATEHVRC